MKVAKVIKFYFTENPFHMSQDLRIRMSFYDRLKFLIHGENCIIRIPNEERRKRTCFIE